MLVGPAIGANVPIVCPLVDAAMDVEEAPGVGGLGAYRVGLAGVVVAVRRAIRSVPTQKQVPHEY